MARSRTRHEVLRAAGLALPETIRVTPERRRRTNRALLGARDPVRSRLDLGGTVSGGDEGLRLGLGWRSVASAVGARPTGALSISDRCRLGRSQYRDPRKPGRSASSSPMATTAQFRRWLEAEGYDARIIETEFEGEAPDPPAEAGHERDTGGLAPTPAAAPQDIYAKDEARGCCMKDFAALFLALDGTTRTSAKVAALAGYFSIGEAGARPALDDRAAVGAAPRTDRDCDAAARMGRRGGWPAAVALRGELFGGGRSRRDDRPRPARNLRRLGPVVDGVESSN